MMMRTALLLPHRRRLMAAVSTGRLSYSSWTSMNCEAMSPLMVGQVSRGFSSSPTKKARNRRKRKESGKMVAEEHTLQHFTVAFVGRPNVGKSSLFNRLARKHIAITHAQPGTTRDVKEAKGYLAGMEFTMMDTGGLEHTAGKESLESRMMQHTVEAIKEADVIVFTVSAKDGLSPEDERIAKWLHGLGLSDNIILVANKAESMINHLLEEENWLDFTSEAFRLGLGEPVPISAEHGDGMNSLFDSFYPYAVRAVSEREQPEHSQEQLQHSSTEPLDDVILENNAETTDESFLNMRKAEDGSIVDSAGNVVIGPSRPSRAGVRKEQVQQQKLEKPINVAIVGRPNVGKSTLLNKLINQSRVLTGPEAGLTRDATEIRWEWKGQEFQLVDTAGMRRFGTFDVRPEVEGKSIGQAKRALALSNVTVLVLDATQGLTKQDVTIASNIVEEGRALVVALNKSDMVTNKAEVGRHIQYSLDRLLPDCKGLEVEHLSALEGTGMSSLMPAIMRTFERWNLRVPTGYLNRWLKQVSKHHPPPARYKNLRGPNGKGSRSVPIKLKYFSQINVRPPTFALFANRVDLPAEYLRFLKNAVRQEFGLYGVPLRLLPRTSVNPYSQRQREKTKNTAPGAPNT